MSEDDLDEGECEWFPSPEASPVPPPTPEPVKPRTSVIDHPRHERVKGRKVTIYSIGNYAFPRPRTFKSMNSCMRELVDPKFNHDWKVNTLKAFKTWAKKHRVAYDLAPSFGGEYMY